MKSNRYYCLFLWFSLYFSPSPSFSFFLFFLVIVFCFSWLSSNRLILWFSDFSFLPSFSFFVCFFLVIVFFYAIFKYLFSLILLLSFYFYLLLLVCVPFLLNFLVPSFSCHEHRERECHVMAPSTPFPDTFCHVWHVVRWQPELHHAQIPSLFSRSVGKLSNSRILRAFSPLPWQPQEEDGRLVTGTEDDFWRHFLPRIGIIRSGPDWCRARENM